MPDASTVLVIEKPRPPGVADEKVEKQACSYQQGTRAAHCGQCSHFRWAADGNNTCQIVTGIIDPGAWCNFYQVAQVRPAADMAKALGWTANIPSEGRKPADSNKPVQEDAKAKADRVAKAGTGGDTKLADVGPMAERLLKRMGGKGDKNPKTGLKRYEFGSDSDRGYGGDNGGSDSGRDGGYDGGIGETGGFGSPEAGLSPQDDGPRGPSDVGETGGFGSPEAGLAPQKTPEFSSDDAKSPGQAALTGRSKAAGRALDFGRDAGVFGDRSKPGFHDPQMASAALAGLSALGIGAFDELGIGPAVEKATRTVLGFGPLGSTLGARNPAQAAAGVLGAPFGALGSITGMGVSAATGGKAGIGQAASPTATADAVSAGIGKATDTSGGAGSRTTTAAPSPRPTAPLQSAPSVGQPAAQPSAPDASAASAASQPGRPSAAQIRSMFARLGLSGSSMERRALSQYAA